MPVDEDLLDQLISDVAVKIDKNTLQRRIFQELQRDAVSIRLIDVPDPEDTQKTRKTLPSDPKLGVEITEERRQAIYDKIISDVAKL